MLFNSVNFLFFFIAVCLLFFIVRPKHRWIVLLVSSYVFYGAWKYEYLILIAVSTVVDFLCAKKMDSLSTKAERKPFLIISLIANLGLLCTFKYLDFFIGTFNEITNSEFGFLHLIVPVGISFYTFQTLSYSIDVYQGKMKAETHLGKFAVYVSFFPQLVAGPIERASNLIPQLQENAGRLAYNSTVSGITQVVVGLFKKVVVADAVAIYVNSIYNNHEANSGFTLLFATYLFAIQIYCDFSGYSDIAIGIARIMGYEFMENFKQPYFSLSVTEFWRRWHISLSSWLKDYLYIPLGGNKKGKIRTYVNLMLTMLIGGLWHGSSWNFVVWGGLNGSYLAIEKTLFGKPNNQKSAPKYLKLIKIIVTFHLICFTWIFFRAQTFNQASSIISSIFESTNFWNLRIQDTGVFATILVGLVTFLFLEFTFLRNLNYKNLIEEHHCLKLIILKVILILMIVGLGITEGSQFIYFQF